MENEEEYNRQVEEELLEQEFLERCFQEMLDEEDQDWFIPERDLPSVGQIQQQLNGLSVSNGNAEEVLRKSILNPEAKEFVPGVKYWGSLLSSADVPSHPHTFNHILRDCCGHI